MSLDDATIKKLRELQARGDGGRAPYYQTLQAAKDPYGRLALGVVQQDQIAGMAAYSYALEVAKRYCRPISASDWVRLSVTLMQSDFAARQNPNNSEPNSTSLTWSVIRDYHVAAFQTVTNLPPVAWTAWIPLYLQGEAKDQKLWHRMLTEDFLQVAVETTSLVLNRWSQKAGVSRELNQSVVPVLKTAPPVVTGSPPHDPAYDRCMKQLAPEQMQQADATKGERIAAFYLDCLGCAVNVVGRPFAPYGGVYGPSWGPSMGDIGRWNSDLPF